MAQMIHLGFSVQVGYDGRVQIDIPKGYGSEMFLFRKVFIPKGHYSERFYPDG